MEVFGFQIFFFILILISGLFGKKVRNIVVIGSVIFTLVMIFTNWLIILQLVTISIAFFVTESYVKKSKEKLEDIDKKYGNGCITFIVVGGIVAILLKIFSDNYQKKKEIDYRNSEIQDSLNFSNDSLLSLNNDTLNYVLDSTYEKSNLSIDTTFIDKDTSLTYNENNNLFYVTTEKAYFYNSPDYRTKRNAYIIYGEIIEPLSEKSEYFYVSYLNSSGVRTKGWILKSDLSKY